MKFTIPFAYRAEVLFPRAEGPKEEVFIETIEVDIPELATGDLDEALRYRIGGESRSIHVGENGFLEEIWRRMGRAAVADLFPTRGMGTPVERLIYRHHPYGSAEYSAIWAWYSNDRARSGRDPAKVREWYRSDREETLQKVEPFYRSIVSIDGLALVPCAEPKFVSPSLNLCTENLTYTSDPNVVGDPLSKPVFNVLDFASAQEDAAARRDWEGHLNYDPGSIEILIPEAFTFDRGRQSLEWAASYLFDVLSKDIRRLPDEAVADWMALRHIVHYTDRPNWDREASAVIERCAPLARNGYSRKRVADMLEIWDNLATVDPMQPTGRPAPRP